MADDSEALGRLAYDAYRYWLAVQPQPWTLRPEPWEKLHPADREKYERIGETIAAVTRAAVRGQVAAALKEHYLAGITCDHARHEDNPVCACSRVFLGWHPSVGQAVEAWITHVMEAAQQ